MKLKEAAEKLGLRALTQREIDDTEVTGGYSGDLLSDVLAHAKSGSLWFTIQRHKNVIAVATAKDIAGIVVVNGVEPEQNLVEAAEKIGVPLFVTEKDAFTCAGMLYALVK
ncbi:MAG TPA: DRTGG domain-containing protein [Candidatus Mcinerneyibacteriales bacterium]|jgi:predicted transcriptional regulator|nr:serine kinase [Candidatus Mcinerneyibacteriota bacterium]HOO60153.1 DRTGG domain-containing protein [Candidatus Mcinerneyibacteriales bacterium]HPE20890.1 DRTGG domain-containing protein [Candidatus Mcinerneyibacteriales bacterium]HPJ70502.1 DRTGG domain-containing protein [Candidatus Mcinerneyibacteriales bacterium]HPQ89789.1 DRTGG domain-containing protein [Candidatus Mcinerneyibacteriales bacterium]